MKRAKQPMPEPTRVARTRTVSLEERRSTILAAALKTFDKHGFEAAKMSGIAAEANIAKGTLYLYFKSKDALLEEVVRSVLHPTTGAAGDAVTAPTGDAADILKTQLRLFAGLMGREEMRTVLRLVISEGHRSENLAQTFWRYGTAPAMEAIRKTLEYGAATGRFRPEAADLAPQIFAAPAIASAIWQMLFSRSDPLDIPAMTEQHIHVVLDGLRPGTTS